MAEPDEARELTDPELAQFFDPGSLHRGRTYAAQGRATIVGRRPGSISAVVRGGAANPYLVTVRWQRPRSGGVAVDDECTCPLGGACKHAVAAVLTARAAAGTATAPAAPGAPARWRQALDRITPEDRATPGTDVALALEVEVRGAVVTRFGPPRPTTVSLRPLRTGKQGRWIKTGASWRDILSPYQHPMRDADPAQVAALRSLLASAGSSVYYYSGPSTIALAQFGPDVWSQLRRLVELGVELVAGGDCSGRVTLADAAAEPVVDLSAADDGAVALRVTLELDGRALPLASRRAQLLGNPAHGVAVLDGPRLTLAGLTKPLHSELARLLAEPPLVVPAGDVDELLDHYQPRLERLARVGSADGSVTVTSTTFDRLVALVERPTIDSATLRWGVRYRRGERTSTHLLATASTVGRDVSAEAKALTELDLPAHLLPELIDEAGKPRDLVLGTRDTITLLDEVLPWLRERDQVAVDISGDAPDLRRATGDPLLSLEVGDPADERSGNDWFDLRVEVRIDDEEVPFAALFAALDRGDDVLVLPTGTWLPLERPELERLRSLITEAQGLSDPDTTDALRINRFQTSWWDELAQLGVVRSQSERWSAALAQMRELGAPAPVPVPAGLAGELRHYQQEGLDWLAFLHRNRLGGILADDMGLGKTIQAIALCLHVLEQRPGARILVVAPTSVVDNWYREARRFAPDLDVRTIRETKARRGSDLADAVGAAHVVVTSYALFRLEIEDYRTIEWELLLLDEAQFVKNHTGKTYQCVRRLDAPVTIAMTGTPLENSLMDLWALLSITAPGLYPDPARFSAVYRKPIESGRAPELLATLRRRIAPLLRRRTKDEVLAELPPKTEQTVLVELNPKHARLYETQLQRQRQKVLGLVGDLRRNRFEIFRSLTILRQLSLDPALIDAEHDRVGSAKLDRLVEDLHQVVDEGHRALVFSQFTRYLARVKRRLDDEGIAYAYLDGRTRKREEVIARFKDGDAPVFVISLKAGGFGLNLTEADYCFVLDPWWNPAVENQAIDRTHRIGQANPVMVYRYIAAGTIEEKVMELKARKAALFADVVEADGALSGPLSEDDIRNLLT